MRPNRWIAVRPPYSTPGLYVLQRTSLACAPTRALLAALGRGTRGPDSKRTERVALRTALTPRCCCERRLAADVELLMTCPPSPEQIDVGRFRAIRANWVVFAITSIFLWVVSILTLTVRDEKGNSIFVTPRPPPHPLSLSFLCH